MSVFRSSSPDCADNGTRSSELSRSKYWNVLQLLAIATSVALAIAGALFFSDRHEAKPTVRPTLVPIDYEKLVKMKVDEAARKDELAVNQFNQGFSKALTHYSERSENAASESANKLSSAEDLSHLLFYLAKDQTNSGSQTVDYLDRETQPTLKPLLNDFGRETNDVIQALDNDLREISVQLAVDLASLGPSNAETPVHVRPAPDVKSKVAADAKRFGLDVTIKSATQIFAKQINAGISKAIPKRVTAIAARMFAKQVAKIAASSTVGSIPSPLPLPQIIALGGFAWTAYDISTLSGDFHDEIYKTMKTELDAVGTMRSSVWSWGCRCRNRATIRESVPKRFTCGGPTKADAIRQ